MRATAYLWLLGFCAVAPLLAQSPDPRYGEIRTGGPAPKRDMNGIWKPQIGAQGTGAFNMPADGKPEHELLYTPFGLEMLKKNKPANGPDAVPSVEDNDPAHACDPQGFPREDLYEMRTTQFI